MVTDGPMEEVLKGSGTTGRLASWAAELRTYHILYIQRKGAEGKIIKERASRRANPNAKGMEVIRGKRVQQRGLGSGIILVDLKGKECAHAIGLNFYASEDNMDYEALLARLVA
ncbi:hypothetical protein Tco_1373922 [Tanacetum coccineum]